MLLPAGRRPATDATFTIRPASRAKMTRGGPRQQKRSAEVDLVDVVPEIGGEALEGSERDADVPARVVDEDVETAELGRGRVDDPRDRGRVPLVELDHGRAPPALFDLTARLDRALAKADPGDGHVGAGLGQRGGDRAAEVARASRDQRRAPGQVHRRLS